MALPSSGPITIQQIAAEFGGSAPYSLSNYYRGGALVANTPANAGIPTSGTIRLSNFYGASKSRVTINLVISANTQNYNVFSNVGGSYVAGNTDVIVTINSGVFVGASSTGVYAMVVSSSFNAGDTVSIVNNGTILGCGGGGGNGGNINTSSATNPGGGGGGGNAIQINRAVSITNNGVIASGGGGGGGGGGGQTGSGKNIVYYRGGGGGGGAGYSAGGGGGLNGGAGSTTGGGAGGGGSTNAGSGGAGGGRGANGASGTGGNTSGGAAGGTAGFYIVGNSNVTWITTGTRLGRVI